MQTFDIEFDHIPWGTAYYKKTGKFCDDDVLSRLQGYDATLFGSIGAPGELMLVMPNFLLEVHTLY